MNGSGKKKLGKGLGAIISTNPAPAANFEKSVVNDSSRIVDLPIDRITANPGQPRIHFDDRALRGLADSISSVGLIEPIIVRKTEKGYFVVAGERRLRAVKLLKQPTIKAVVIEADEEKNYTIALIENIQREDLDPIEEAKAYQVLIDKFKLKQADLAKKVGKERATITNSLRLLNLPEEIQHSLSEGQLSPGHAKVLLSAPENKQLELYAQILEEGLSVRALEMILKGERKPRSEDGEETAKGTGSPRVKDAQVKKMEDRLRQLLGTKIEIKHSGNRGKIEISYYSLDDFERIVEMFNR